MANNEPDRVGKAEPESVLRWIFRDRSTGRIVVAQLPNVWLWIFSVALLLSYFVEPSGAAYTTVKSIELGSLSVWAVDEVFRGVNPWRRFLGIATLVGIAFLLLASLK